MSGSLNRCQFIGNVGKDPQTRTFQSGGKVANFSLACAEQWKDRNTGEKKEKTEWINIAVYGDGLVGVIERFVRKGSKLFVEGKMQTRKWQDQSGNDRYTTEVVVQGFGGQVIMLDGKRDGGGGGGQSGGGDGGDYGNHGFGAGGYQGGRTSGSRPQPAAFDSDLDDDVPF